MEFMRHYSLPSEAEVECAEFRVVQQVAAMLAESFDNAVIHTIIDFAKQEGITDLFLIDKEFVKTALLREIERRKEGDEYAPTADVVEVVRCKDCIYQEGCWQKVDSEYGMKEIVYCSHGERKEK